MFGDVLNTMIQFLQTNKKETLFVRVKEEHFAENCDKSFEDIFEEYYKRYSSYITIPNDSNPKLGTLRGKIVFLQNFVSRNRQYGLSYKNFNIQDKHSVSTNWDLYSKWESVKEHFKKTSDHPNSGVYINYLSASGGSFPYFIASGHSNPATGASRLATGRTTPGWQESYPDFPGSGLIDAIIKVSLRGQN